MTHSDAHINPEGDGLHTPRRRRGYLLPGGQSDHDLRINVRRQRARWQSVSESASWRLSIKNSKCKLSVNNLIWLRCEVDENGFAPKFLKIESLKLLKPPWTLKQIRSFTGTLTKQLRFLPEIQKFNVHFHTSLMACNKQPFSLEDKQNVASYNIC